MIVTVDSSVCIDFLKGRANQSTKQLERLLDDSTRALVILDVVLLEVLRGIQDEQEHQQVYDSLLPFVVQTAGGKDIAIASAQIYRHLRKNGLTVRSSIDLLIAAWCLTNDCELLHNDRDFDSIASHYPLKIWNPTCPTFSPPSPTTSPTLR
jgi:predicted nucleic acid-binding protein